MRSQNAFRHLLVTTFATLGLVSVSERAWADDKKECGASYDQAQTLRVSGKLLEARQQAVSCAREVCAEFIRTDCAKWMSEIDQSQPTVVFELHDAEGHDTRDVKVLLDGKPWLEQVDGGAKPINPGQHKLHYVMEGQTPVDDTVEIREGEKNRKLTASFQKVGAEQKPMIPEKHVDSAPPEAPAASRTPAPWIVGGIGVGALIVGAVTGALVLHDKSVDKKECPNNRCSADGFDKAKQGKTLGPVTTAALVVGGVGVGVGTIWLIARPSAPKSNAPPEAALSMGPVVNMSGAAWRFEGSF